MVMECKDTARKSHYPKDMPFEVPEGWVWCKIEDIAESNVGLTYKPEDVCSDGVPVLRSNNIKNRRICTDGLIRVRAHILPKRAICLSALVMEVEISSGNVRLLNRMRSLCLLAHLWLSAEAQLTDGYSLS